MVVPRGLLVTWDVVTDGSSSCARSSIIHDITVVREADGTIIVSVDDIEDTQIGITDSSLEPRQNYSIHVGTRLLHNQGMCKTGEAASTVCTGMCIIMALCISFIRANTTVYYYSMFTVTCWPARPSPLPLS